MAEQQVIPHGKIPLRERRTLAEEWKEFRETVIAKYAPAMQVEEMRKAFYSGAFVMFGLATDLDPDAEPTELDVQYMQSLYAELTAFRRTLDH